MAIAPQNYREVKTYADASGLWFYDNGWKLAGGGEGGAPLESNVVVLPSGTTNYNVPAGTFVLALVFNDPLLPTVSVGLSPVTKEIVEDFTLQTPEEAASINKPFTDSTTIYFTGITAGTVIKIYKL